MGRGAAERVIEASVTEKAKTFVKDQLEGEGKCAEAAERILRKRVHGRHDPMSVAIRNELDRRSNRNDPLGGWTGWE
jgi:hypothetical protein